MNPLEEQLAEQLTLARLHAVTLTAVEEADLTALLAFIASLEDGFSAKYGLPLPPLPFFLKAAVAALRQTPALVLVLHGGNDDGHAATGGLDLSVALPARGGSILPVVRDCDRKSLAELAVELAALAARARVDEITIPELQGGMFTLTGREDDGMLFGTPLLNPPQSAALVVHAPRPRPVAIGDCTRVRPVARLALAYDARVVPTALAAAFLARFRAALAEPLALLF